MHPTISGRNVTMIRSNVLLSFTAILSHLSVVANSTAPIRKVPLYSPPFGARTGRRKQSRPRVLDVCFVPRGGAAADANADVEDLEEENVSAWVSVTADETLPAEIAGADVGVESPSTPTTSGGETAVASTPPTPSSPSMFAVRLANLQERSLPAVLMLLVVGSVAKFLKEDGLILLTLVLQGGMYQETTRVIGGDFPHLFYKWWWFITGSVALNGPRILSWASTKITAGAAGMTIAGIISAVIGMNWKNAEVDEFRDLLRQAAVSFLATLLVVLPSSYWIATLEEFGMKWVALPAALVIINDTMAYFFGIALGKHKLLPVISPSKTWEGFWGAALSTGVAAYFLLDSKQDVIFLSLAASFVAPFGGFLASMIKRAYAQKDFGSLFPGHGGFVDRLDCQLILAPIVFLYLSLAGGKKN